MIVLVSLVLYRYLAPKTWREWASAGLVQAFIIALYAEMYGFPLTIYLLVRFFGLDNPNLNANLWSTLPGMGELGMMISMILGYVLLFIGIGLFIQGWRELYRARQKIQLETSQVCQRRCSIIVSGYDVPSLMETTLTCLAIYIPYKGVGSLYASVKFCKGFKQSLLGG